MLETFADAFNIIAKKAHAYEKMLDNGEQLPYSNNNEQAKVSLN